MANVDYANFPYGLRDISVANLAETLQEDLNAAQELTFTPEIVTADQRGDDVIKETMSFIQGGSAQVTSGAISSAAMAIMYGYTLTITGSSPTEEAEFSLVEGHSLPWFRLYGKAEGPDGSDVHVYLGRCKVIGGGGISFRDGQYFSPSFNLRVLGDESTGKVWTVIQHETAEDIPDVTA